MSGSRSGFFLVITCICTGSDSGSGHHPHLVHHSCSARSVQVKYEVHEDDANRGCTSRKNSPLLSFTTVAVRPAALEPLPEVYTEMGACTWPRMFATI